MALIVRKSSAARDPRVLDRDHPRVCRPRREGLATEGCPSAVAFSKATWSGNDRRARKSEGAGARAHLSSYRRSRARVAAGKATAQPRWHGSIGVGEVARVLAR